MTEYYAPRARAEVEEVEAVVWGLVQAETPPRFSDSTVRWADILEHPQTGKFGCILPEDWRELNVDISEVNIQTQTQMEAAGWFPVNEI